MSFILRTKTDSDSKVYNSIFFIKKIKYIISIYLVFATLFCAIVASAGVPSSIAIGLLVNYVYDLIKGDSDGNFTAREKEDLMRDYKFLENMNMKIKSSIELTQNEIERIDSTCERMYFLMQNTHSRIVSTEKTVSSNAKHIEKILKILEDRYDRQQDQINRNYRKFEHLEGDVIGHGNKIKEIDSRTNELREHADYTNWILGGIGLSALVGAGVLLGGSGDDETSSASTDTSSTNSNPASSNSQSLTVSASNSSWTYTDISLASGQNITISVSGCAENDSKADCLGPDGRGYADGYNARPAPDLNALSLVGKIGSSIFYVGSHYTGPAPASGDLAFIYNDSKFDDNSGSFQVTVEY
ncbi:MAG: hypothetical protein D3908_02060 [Candidatus Electrothrix sp. AUS4]|nr:hypothetical protein [Candidatus Electrothrix sp. AUS4]